MYSARRRVGGCSECVCCIVLPAVPAFIPARGRVTIQCQRVSTAHDTAQTVYASAEERVTHEQVQKLLARQPADTEGAHPALSTAPAQQIFQGSVSALCRAQANHDTSAHSLGSQQVARPPQDTDSVPFSPRSACSHVEMASEPEENLFRKVSAAPSA